MTPETLSRIKQEAEEKYPDTLRVERHVLRYIREAHIAGATSRQGQVESLTKRLEERDQLALEFADYLENERWKYDHKEQKTHTIPEHWEYFKQISSPPETDKP